jgi:hypothetical protein
MPYKWEKLVFIHRYEVYQVAEKMAAIDTVNELYHFVLRFFNIIFLVLSKFRLYNDYIPVKAC